MADLIDPSGGYRVDPDHPLFALPYLSYIPSGTTLPDGYTVGHLSNDLIAARLRFAAMKARMLGYAVPFDDRVYPLEGLEENWADELPKYTVPFVIAALASANTDERPPNFYPVPNTMLPHRLYLVQEFLAVVVAERRTWPSIQIPTRRFMLRSLHGWDCDPFSADFVKFVSDGPASVDNLPGYTAWEYRFNVVFEESGVSLTSLGDESTIYGLDPKQPVKINEISVDVAINDNNLDGT